MWVWEGYIINETWNPVGTCSFISLWDEYSQFSSVQWAVKQECNNSIKKTFLEPFIHTRLHSRSSRFSLAMCVHFEIEIVKVSADRPSAAPACLCYLPISPPLPPPTPIATGVFLSNVPLCPVALTTDRYLCEGLLGDQTGEFFSGCGTTCEFKNLI